ncbi:carboxypeptidase-like regulatory domain-containing protein [Polaribacter aquimarinus]|uniref:Fibronectin type-III domain-containing protein n=1 Tax=Polaribacter aquimarinus TaxID=2100726 RepID=A0A2U2J8A2_9FLAO|nr:carbohydrate binding domain-containing protein [Polaribacter aquimarinus]PWG04573.1 hypothetical protein DIS07_11550 [Polaribacter aquimarinus]
MNLKYFIIITLILFSCSRNENLISNVVKLSGYVKSAKNIPEENVKVSISDFQNLTVLTDSEGYFEINNLSKGEHELILFKNKINSNSDLFVRKTFNISSNSDTVLDNLILPNPVFLQNAINITSSSATINWNSSSSVGFREYKLYRHSNSGLDETTGKLIHVTTDINEISFTDTNLNNSETYYYRIYVLDEYGQIGGSNVINFKTDEVKVIKNGGFEDLINGKPDYWNLVPNNTNNPKNTIEIDNLEFEDGVYSLKFRNADINGCYEQWIKQDIKSDILIEGATYRLVFDYKSDFTLSNNNSVSIVIRNFSDLDKRWYLGFDFIDDGQWRKSITEFTLPNQFTNNNIDFIIHFCINPTGYWWLDNVSIDRIK